ncbi:MAG: hypothetical protein WC359_12470 [Dehalococcoidia bacterium]
MWDIDSIIRENNRVALQYMEQGQDRAKALYPQPEYWPLSLLTNKLLAGPPALKVIINMLTEFGSLENFRRLIREFLPDKEKEILREPLSRRIYRFRYLFAQKYYPLPDKTDNIGYFADIMPIDLLGLSYDTYHEIDMRPGYLLLLSLIVYPYQGSERSLSSEDFYGEKDAGRVPLLGKVQQMIGKEIARRIPKDGWDPETLHKFTDGTKYDGLGGFADWATGQTGCAMLDFSYSGCHYEQGSSEPAFEWSMNNVERLTQEWPRMYSIRAKIDRLAEQVEYSTAYFSEMLEFLLQKTPAGYKPDYSYDEENNWCDLEIKLEDDYEEDYDEEPAEARA